MNVVVVLEHRFLRTPDGRVWTPTTFACNFWQRYLEVFDSVRVVARVQDVPDVPNGCRRADGENVTFASVPHYVGPWQFALRVWSVTWAVQEAVTSQDAVILRVPSTLANLLVPVLRKRGQPFGLEVVGDPWDVFSPGAFKWPWPVRVLARFWFTRALKQQCREAAAVAYVTKFALQRRYPPNPTAFVTDFSSVELLPSDFVPVPRTFGNKKGPFTLITVGSLAQMYKGVDVLIDAVALCIKEGWDIRLLIVGEGRHRPDLEAQSRERKIEDRVRFLGQLPAGEPVRAQLDQADLFILASRQEGLPRAMIEAMARGLPCIGTTVGGIPELLPPEDLVPPNDPYALAAKIKEVLRSPERMARMSMRNLQKAQEYREEVLQARRRAFYQAVKEITVEWKRRQNP
jgi:glycosyltransferase involved in cell wall biosynthesis